MRTFVIADVHGKNELFKRALEEIDLQPSDELIILGDLIDRGEDSKGVLDTVISLKERGYNITCLFGNHEQMLLDSFLSEKHYDLWLYNGGGKTLSSFQAGSIDEIPRKYIDFIRSFTYYVEHEKYIFVHAALNMKIENPFQDITTMIWGRNPADLLDMEWLGNKKLIHGHTPIELKAIQASHKRNDPILNIDNGAFLEKENYGSLCILELEKNKENYGSLFIIDAQCG